MDGLRSLAEESLPPDWRKALAGAIASPTFAKLGEYLDGEFAAATVFPSRQNIFAAFRHTPLNKVKVVILGQDPYHDDGQAHGLAFSVPRGVRPPPSLRNIFKELQTDIGVPSPKHGCLESWADRGVLLLNAVLTVRAHSAGSHQGKGWEAFTDGAISAVASSERPAVFLLWGAHAKKKMPLIGDGGHTVLTAGHPSPLSVRHFLGCKHFSAANAALEASGRGAVDWSLVP